MDRAQCESEIYKHMQQIRRIRQKYSPSDDYLALFVNNDGTISFNNSYWALPDNQKINFNEVVEEE
jgi:hypothetical protein